MVLHAVKSALTPAIKEGTPFSPKHNLKEHQASEADVSLANPTQGTILILGLPAAFSGTCSNQVPGYVQQVDALKAKGIESVYVVTVNDVFVTKAWAKDLGADQTGGYIRILSDDTGKFTQSIGLDFDASALLGNPRSKRYAAIIKAGVVHKIVVEEDPTALTVTHVDNVLRLL